MLLNSPARSPIYRLRASQVTDAYGDAKEDWTTPDRVALHRALTQDITATELDGIERRLVRGEKTLFVPGRIDLTDDDRVEVDGEVWRVDAPPTVRRGLASTVYTAATLRRVSS